jgi:hypothetical protein
MITNLSRYTHDKMQFFGNLVEGKRTVAGLMRGVAVRARCAESAHQVIIF